MLQFTSYTPHDIEYSTEVLKLGLALEVTIPRTIHSATALLHRAVGEKQAAVISNDPSSCNVTVVTPNRPSCHLLVPCGEKKNCSGRSFFCVQQCWFTFLSHLHEIGQGEQPGRGLGTSRRTSRRSTVVQHTLNAIFTRLIAGAKGATSLFSASMVLAFGNKH